jgi:hypothetical protein
LRLNYFLKKTNDITHRTFNILYIPALTSLSRPFIIDSAFFCFHLLIFDRCYKKNLRFSLFHGSTYWSLSTVDDFSMEVHIYYWSLSTEVHRSTICMQLNFNRKSYVNTRSVHVSFTGAVDWFWHAELMNSFPVLADVVRSSDIYTRMPVALH